MKMIFLKCLSITLKYVLKTAKPNDFQHQYMADRYRGVIKEALKQYDRNQHNEDYYNALSWNGLKNTAAWNKLSSTEKTKILETIQTIYKMGRTVISLYLFCVCSIAYAQKIDTKTIYIKFNLEKKCIREQKFFHETEGGTVFNLFSDKGRSFLWSSKSDTLPISNLKNYKIATLEEIEVLEKKWRRKNKKTLIKRFGKLYPPFDKNYIFQTYLLEVINDTQFVTYPVEWRNLDVIAD